MHSYWLVLFFLTAMPAVFTVSSASHWDDMRIRHIWGVVPENWESLGPPPAGTTINLRIALKNHRENALIDTLYEVSSPNHPRRVSPPPLEHIYSRIPVRVQIRRAPVAGAGR